MSSSTFTEGAIIAGKYRVERVLGQGGMGVVVAATQLELKRKVALKFMLPGTLGRPQAEGRFLREARAAAGLSSEHSVRIFDFGRLEQGAAFLVMEYLEGTDLAALVERQGALPVPTAVDYVLQAAVGLAEAHARGIVHRDIKPQNLFLSRSPSGAALIKVLDFGVSKVTPAFSGFDDTKSGALLGSPGYMAPEQMRAAHEVDARADLWALGCTLYLLLSAHDPFEAGSLAELCAQVLHAEPRPLPELCVLPAALAACIQRCLAKDPAQRPADLAQLADELAPFAPGSGARLAAAVRGALAGGREAAASGVEPVFSRGTHDGGASPLRSRWRLLGALAAVLATLALGRALWGSADPAPNVPASARPLPMPPAPPQLPAPPRAKPASLPPVAIETDAGADSAPGLAIQAVPARVVQKRAAPAPLPSSVSEATRPSAAATPVEPAVASRPAPAPVAAPLDPRDPRLMRH